MLSINWLAGDVTGKWWHQWKGWHRYSISKNKNDCSFILILLLKFGTNIYKFECSRTNQSYRNRNGKKALLHLLASDGHLAMDNKGDTGKSGYVDLMESTLRIMFMWEIFTLVFCLGPKLFVKPSSKSNRHIIINAISQCVLAGPVNSDQKNKVLEVKV